MRFDATFARGQQQHWAETFRAHPDMYGLEPSEAAVAAADRFTEAGISDVVELGAGQGRDTLYLAARGLRVTAFDFAPDAVRAIRDKARAAGIADRVTVERRDVRAGVRLGDGAADACYSHMLFCMAFTTAELERLAGEVHRVVRPGGLVVYTARTTEDAHFGAGIPRGDDMYEQGGFIVHFFDDALVQRLASGFELVETAAFSEGELPRRLVRVTMRVRDR
jgi:SAM-dependent methyltransferase